jgi:putative transposase
MSYESNCHGLYSSQYPVVFCPKYRRKVLPGRVDKRLKEILYQIANELSFEIWELEVMPGHLHILCEAGLQFGVHKFVKRIKSISSRWLRQEFPCLKSRLPTLWTHSYFVSTVGCTPIAILKQYIENQKNV